jgi:hypothetical protein
LLSGISTDTPDAAGGNMNKAGDAESGDPLTAVKRLCFTTVKHVTPHPDPKIVRYQPLE